MYSIIKEIMNILEETSVNVLHKNQIPRSNAMVPSHGTQGIEKK